MQCALAVAGSRVRDDVTICRLQAKSTVGLTTGLTKCTGALPGQQEARPLPVAPHGCVQAPRSGNTPASPCREKIPWDLLSRGQQPPMAGPGLPSPEATCSPRRPLTTRHSPGPLPPQDGWS